MSKINVEVAEKEFERFAEAMDLDLDPSLMDNEDLTAFNKQKRRLIRAIEKGSLVFNEAGEAEYTPVNDRSKHKETLIFRERSGASLMAMDSKKKNHDVAKSYAVLADMCGVPQNVFAGLVGVDVKICEALFALLMD